MPGLLQLGSLKEQESRKLVTIRQIIALDRIPGADTIDVATIDGWKVVVKKGEFVVGEDCLYFEIDSFLPESDPRYRFLMKSSRMFEGVRGHKLRTIKLRGQMSQGLALPLDAFPELMIPASLEERALLRDLDFAEALGIKKFELPIPASLAGEVKGLFPSFIRKTDQERCQNLIEEIFTQNKDAKYEITIKLDGTSVTYYFFKGDRGACSRNLELMINDANKDNTIVKLFKESGLIESGCQDFAIQGELMGPGIQCNRESLKTHCFYVFDVQNLVTGEYLSPAERAAFMESLYVTGHVNKEMVLHIPVLNRNVSLIELGIMNTEDLLDFAEGPSLNSKVREGVVFRREDGRFSFKAISNAFLEHQDD